MTGYLFEHSWEQERQRLAELEAVFDPGTIHHLKAVGVPVGGRCLEVGAGAGSIARWLCQAVGPDGQVVATDLQTGFLEQLAEANLEVRCHDVVCDELETGSFDLIHARLVLEHIPEREVCLKRLAAALAPGGVLLVEDFDWGSLAVADEDARPLFDLVMEALLETMTAAGYDHRWALRLPGLLRAAGLVEVAADGRVPFVQPGSVESSWWYMSVLRLREPMLARGAVTEADLDRYLARLADPGMTFLFLTLIAAWGRRPRA